MNQQIRKILATTITTSMLLSTIASLAGCSSDGKDKKHKDRDDEEIEETEETEETTLVETSSQETELNYTARTMYAVERASVYDADGNITGFLIIGVDYQVVDETLDDYIILYFGQECWVEKDALSEVAPTEEPTETPTPEPRQPYEFDMDEVASYEQLWIDYVTTDTNPLQIDNDVVRGEMQIVDALNGTVYLGITYKFFIQDRDVYPGSVVHVRDFEYVIGEYFEADAVSEWTDETRHVSGYSIENCTNFNDDGTLDLGPNGNLWLEFDENHNAWYFGGYEAEDDIGFHTVTTIYGNQVLPISENCEIYYSKGGVYNLFNDEGIYSLNDGEAIGYDSLGNYSVVERYAMRFVPVNGSDNVVRDFIDYLSEYGCGNFLNRGTNSFITENTELSYGDIMYEIASSTDVFVQIENGEITKIYFPWIPCGSIHWSDGISALGTEGTGDFMFDPY